MNALHRAATGEARPGRVGRLRLRPSISQAERVPPDDRIGHDGQEQLSVTRRDKPRYHRDVRDGARFATFAAHRPGTRGRRSPAGHSGMAIRRDDGAKPGGCGCQRRVRTPRHRDEVIAAGRLSRIRPTRTACDDPIPPRRANMTIRHATGETNRDGRRSTENRTWDRAGRRNGGDRTIIPYNDYDGVGHTCPEASFRGGRVSAKIRVSERETPRARGSASVVSKASTGQIHVATCRVSRASHRALKRLPGSFAGEDCVDGNRQSQARHVTEPRPMQHGFVFAQRAFAPFGADEHVQALEQAPARSGFVLDEQFLGDEQSTPVRSASKMRFSR